jgi:hypothetical protein
MKLPTMQMALFLSACVLFLNPGAINGQVLEIIGAAKAGSYQMGTVKMVPAGSGFKSIRFENETEILAEFNASIGSAPPTFKVGQIKIGNIEIVNPSSLFPNTLFFNNGNTSILSIGLTGSSMTTAQFDIHGSVSVRHTTTGSETEGLSIAQTTTPFHRWRLYTAPTTGNLEFYLDNTLKGSINATNGSYTATSDRRLKSTIRELGPILSSVLQLEPKSYVFKDAPDANRSIGFIAQEVAELFPDLVQGVSDGGEILGLNYGDFGVLAIKAIQEQQITIDRLEQRIADLESSLVKRHSDHIQYTPELRTN